MNDAEMVSETRRTIESYRWMNDGRGVAVGPNMAKALAKHGVTEGYFEAVEIHCEKCRILDRTA